MCIAKIRKSREESYITIGPLSQRASNSLYFVTGSYLGLVPSSSLAVLLDQVHTLLSHSLLIADSSATNNMTKQEQLLTHCKRRGVVKASLTCLQMCVTEMEHEIYKTGILDAAKQILTKLEGLDAKIM